MIEYEPKMKPTVKPTPVPIRAPILERIYNEGPSIRAREVAATINSHLTGVPVSHRSLQEGVAYIFAT